MLVALLDNLSRDVSRFLQAGAPAAAGDERLGKRATALRPLGAKVPALAVLAAAIERVTAAAPEQTTAPLLDLLVLLRQVRGGLATNGVEGELEPLPPSGPWATPAHAREVYAYYDLDENGFHLQETRYFPLKDAFERGTAIDLRHLPKFLDLLTQPISEMADLVALHLLPKLGKSILPELFPLRTRHPRILLAAYRIDSATGLEWAPEFLKAQKGYLATLAERGPTVVQAFMKELDRMPNFPAGFDLFGVAAEALQPRMF
jgi:hypothetical protein